MAMDLAENGGGRTPQIQRLDSAAVSDKMPL
jgi:hypothetical protein